MHVRREREARVLTVNDFAALRMQNLAGHIRRVSTSEKDKIGCNFIRLTGATVAVSTSNRRALAVATHRSSSLPQASAIMRSSFDKVVAPYMIGSFRPQPNARSVIWPQPSSRLLFGGNLQALPPPNALHWIFADTPTRLVQQCRDATVSVAAVFAESGSFR